MTHRFKMLRAGLYALVLPCVTLTALVPYAHAETPPREALLGLARNFVDRVGGGFKRADDYLAQIMPDDMRAAESFVDIPDGEILLLKIKLGKTYLSDTVMGIKEGRDVLLSLRDFTAIARFAIDVRPEEGIAEGWFIREDQKFQLDTNTGQVIAGDQRFTFDSDMVRVQDGDIYVRGQALGTWLGFEMNLEFGQQIAEIESEQKWPVENMLARRQRRLAKQQPSAQLPRQDNPYTLATVPNVDIALRQSYERDGDGGDARKSTDYTVSTAGDLAGHTAVGVFTGNDENKLSSARLTLSKESENPDLLGPLKARRYEFGDIGATQVPLSGNARAGLGVRVSSSNANVVTGSVTQITGDAQPGWDVELSRNNQILDLVTVGDDGRYVFDDVRLLSGENDFKIVQYGPLGELREDRQKVISSTNLLSGGRGVYDVSVTAADTQIWQKDDSKTLDQGNPQLSGTYEMQVASDMTVKTGARSITQNDDRKNFVYAGTAKSFGNVLANADASYDLDGALSTQLGARVRMGNHSASATLGYQGEDFGTVNGDTAPASYQLNTTLGGPLYQGEQLRSYYDINSQYRYDDDGNKTIDNSLNLTASTGRLSVGQSFRNLRQDVAGGTDIDQTTGTTSVRGPLLGARWRASANYDIRPDFHVNNYVLDVTRRISPDIRSNISLEHQPEVKYTEAKASLSWDAGVATIAPSLSYDSENNLGAFMNVRMSLARDPVSGKIISTGRNLVGSGGFSALVYLDHDGDRQYDDEIDELLPNVTLRALQSYRNALTDENGRVFIYDLPAGRITDIILEENSLPDAFWISAFEGVSVNPRPGYVAHAEFPVHIAGEIDGTLRVVNQTGSTQPLRGVNMVLYDETGRTAATAASAPDGFYLFDRVPPGKYLLMIDDVDARRYKLARGVPQEIVIGYDGTMIYGNDITVGSGSADVPVGFATSINDYLTANPHIPHDPLTPHRIVLNLGSYRSQLLMGLMWYEIRHRYAGLVGQGQLMVPPSQSFAVPETGLHQLLVAMPPGLSLNEAVGRCRALAARELVCKVEMVPAADQPEARTAQVTERVN